MISISQSTGLFSRKEELLTASLITLQYQDGQESITCREPLTDGAMLRVPGALLEANIRRTQNANGGESLLVKLEVISGHADNIAIGIEWAFSNWSEDHWVFLPACVYAGNRFPLDDPNRRGIPYEPAPDPDNWIKLSSAPHLTHGPGPSRLQVLTGDCSTPAVGILCPDRQLAYLLLTDQGTPLGDHVLEISESSTRDSARLILKTPGVREGGKYNYSGPLSQQPANLTVGQKISLRANFYEVPASTPDHLYQLFLKVRKDLAPIRRRVELPFRTAFKLIESKHNRSNWVEPDGYWSVGMRESSSQNFQTGWVGGPNTIWPLLISGDPTSFHHALRAWDFVSGSATESGFLIGSYHQGKWQDPDHRPAYLRYSADTLYFLMKTLLHLRVGPPHLDPPPAWISLAEGLANAFVKVWQESGHFPHYCNTRTGAVHLGGSCAAALAPASLALAARYFSRPHYLQIAQAAARRYDTNFLSKGVTNGGPGDIHQNVDSESAAALLESFIVLAEESDLPEEWIEASRRAAAYCATWVTSYDFRFPPESTFGKLDMLTTGTVWANVQNKHAAPGICTLSGASLLKLWRATGEAVWLDLLRDIASCIPQYVSREDRPIPDIRPGKRWKVMPPGWVNERVNLSDWEVRGDPEEEIGVGEIFGGSCWSESAALNTFAEVPGIILDLESLEITVIDHVYAQIERATPGEIVLQVTNPTPFEAAPILLAEHPGERQNRWLGCNPLAGLPALTVPSGQTRSFFVSRLQATRQAMQ
ncbi:MAG: hypothetical protein ACFCU4_05910 [Puniceicoccaceae bacterium]